MICYLVLAVPSSFLHTPCSLSIRSPFGNGAERKMDSTLVVSLARKRIFSPFFSLSLYKQQCFYISVSWHTRHGEIDVLQPYAHMYRLQLHAAEFPVGKKRHMRTIPDWRNRLNKSHTDLRSKWAVLICYSKITLEIGSK